MDYLREYAQKVGAPADGLPQATYKSSTDERVRRHAVLTLQDAAATGSVVALCELSECYLFGTGVPKSPDKAASFAMQASQRGFAPGHYLRAYCLERGIGSAPDLRTAEQLLQSAAEDGYGPAATYLAGAYAEGRFGETDLRKALSYASLAAGLGDAVAAMMLGEWYESGKGVQADPNQAIQWYDRAARLGNPVACLKLSMAYSLGQLGVTRNLERAREYERLADDASKC